MEELEKYQILFSEIDELVYFCDTEGNILSVNPVFEKLTGHKPEEFLGKPFAYLFDAENLKKAMNAYTRTLKGESLKYELYFKDTGILCEYKNIPLRDKKGNITGVIGFARDISEHKRMHEEICLLQSITQEISVSKDLHDAMVVTLQKICNFTGWVYGEAWMPRPDGTVLERNHRFYSSLDGFEIFDKKSGAFTFPPGIGLPGRAWSAKQPIWVQDVTLDSDYLRALIAREVGLKTGIAFPVITPSEEVVSVIVFYHLKVLEKDEQLIKLVLAVLSQIGLMIKRKQAEEKLIQTEDKYRTLVEQMPAITYIAAPDEIGTILYISPQIKSMTGFSPEEWVADPKLWFKQLYPDDHMRVLAEYKSSYEKGIPFKSKYRWLTRDGRVLWCYDYAILVKDNAGKPLFLQGIVFDITESKRTEEELEKLKEQLYHAQNLASVAKLAGGIAHNYNNILQVILGYASLLVTSTKKDDPLRNYAQKIMQSSQTAANLTNDLLTFSRKKPINPLLVDLNSIIKEVKPFLSRLIRENITLKTVLTDKDCIVMADIEQIKHILMNLVTNALDAMHEGGFLVISTDVVEMDRTFIKAHGFGEIGKYVLMSISDTGIGMDEDTKLRIFEPFFTTKEVGKGTGLGLSIVYGIAKEHNGYINVDSAPGKGTTFRIYLPLIKSTIEHTKAEFHTITPEGSICTILLAEDEPEVRNLIKIVLEVSGCKVIEAVDGEDAINKFIKNKDSIQLLVFDLITPKKSGKEAYDAIKKIRPDIKVLFISGYGDDIIAKTNIYKDGLTYILKPVSPTEILEKVKYVMNN